LVKYLSPPQANECQEKLSMVIEELPSRNLTTSFLNSTAVIILKLNVGVGWQSESEI
jgi:hypothetical protein